MVSLGMQISLDKSCVVHTHRHPLLLFGKNGVMYACEICQSFPYALGNETSVFLAAADQKVFGVAHANAKIVNDI